MVARVRRGKAVRDGYSDFRLPLGEDARRGEPGRVTLCYGSATSKRGLTMNRNVTIGLGTLILIIIVVALLF
ncbi:MAG TPA: hypothetical protein VF688_02710 [Allosphingosinicella sp.]